MTSNKEYKNVIFDLGNVLLAWDPVNFLDRLQLPAHFKEVFKSLLWATYDGGWLTPEEVVAKLPPQYDKAVFAYCMQRVPGFLDPIEEMIEIFHHVRRKGYKVFILSNMPKEFHLELSQMHDFFQYTDGEIYSYKIGAIKPQPQIYEALLDTYKLKGHESIFIDDLEDNIRAAQRLGIDGIVCQNPAQVRAELERRAIV